MERRSFAPSTGDEARFRAIVDTVPAMVFTAGPDGERDYHNRWWCDFTGFSLEAATGSGWVRALHPEDRERALASWADAVRRGGPWESRHRLRSRDGSHRWVLARAVPVSDPSGEAPGWTGVVLEIDESVRAQEALRGSEERFARFMRHLPGLAWIKDLEGRYVYANDAAVRAFRTPRAELYGRTDGEIFPAEAAAQFKENDRRALASEGGIQTTETLEHEDGILHSSLVSKFPIPGPDGGPGMVGGIAFDVTDLERAQESLRASDRRFRLAFEASPNGMIMVAEDGAIVLANAEIEKLFGYREEELAGRPVEILLPERFRAGHATLRDGFLAEPAERPMGIGRDLYGLREDGSEFPVEIGLNPLREEAGLFVLASIIDITERKRAQEALRASEAGLRVMAEAVPGILFTATPDGQLDYLNQRFHELTGIPVESGKGRGWLEALHPDDRRRVDRRWTEAMRLRDPYESRQRIRARDGVYRWMLARALPVLDGAGEVVKWIGVAFDIEDSVRAEEGLKEADRRKNEFLATLAHELRNPLAPLRSGLEILGLPSADGEARERVREMMERQLGQMVRLIDDLLDISRVTTGKIELRKEGVELAAVVDAAVEATRPEMEASGHALAVSLPAEPIRLQADPVRLAQVIQNLLNNAARFTEDGGRIRLSAAREAGDVVLRVRDTGVGIEPEALPRIFEMFEQARPPRDPAERSLGIGLSLVRALVELHGGAVEALSEGPGRGSEFVVRLPLGPLGAGEARGPEPGAPVGAERPAATEARRVLVVDDNRDAAESLAILLSALGHETRTAYDGPGGLEVAAAFLPDVALLDLGLSGMSGYEMARTMRETPELEGVVLIAVTGWGEESARDGSREAGFRHHLVKPVDFRELKRLLASPEPGPPEPGPPESR